MRTVRVVSQQHASDQAEGIGQTTLLQGELDGHGCVAGAEFFLFDMGMGDMVVIFGGEGVQGDDVETEDVRRLLEPAPEKPDGERPKADVLQGDGLRDSGNALLWEVNLQAAYVIVDLTQFFYPRSQVRNCHGGLFEQALHHISGFTKLIELGQDLVIEAWQERGEMTGLNLVKPAASMLERKMPLLDAINGVVQLLADLFGGLAPSLTQAARSAN
ncbi:MAG TPA: hypothetical protein VE988_06010 [Gemmataceae bacterium]|nr:hypothetical protein [Gemmataceae bacterium]